MERVWRDWRAAGPETGEQLDWKAVGLKAVRTTQRSRVQTDLLEESLIIGTELGSSVDLDQELGNSWTGILWNIGFGFGIVEIKHHGDD